MSQAPSSASFPPTPRAQLGRVVVGTVLGVLLGAGPALAWDLSTAPPRKPASAAAAAAEGKKPVWKGLGGALRKGAQAVARIYLPKEDQEHEETIDQESAPAIIVMPGAGSTGVPTPAPSPNPTPTVYHGPVVIY